MKKNKQRTCTELQKQWHFHGNAPIWTCQCPTVDGRSSGCIGEATEPVSQIDTSICKACEPIKDWGLWWTCEDINMFSVWCSILPYLINEVKIKQTSFCVGVVKKMWNVFFLHEKLARSHCAIHSLRSDECPNRQCSSQTRRMQEHLSKISRPTQTTLDMILVESSNKSQVVTSHCANRHPPTLTLS